MKKIFRKILKSKIIQRLAAASKARSMPGGKGHSIYRVASVFRQYTNWQNLLERAASISYNIIMALPPSLLFLFTLIPVLPFLNNKSIKIQLHELIYDIIPAKVHNKDIIDFVDKMLDNTKVGLLSFGFIFALFFASNAIMGMMRTFDRGYPGFKKRKGLIKRWIAIKITIINFSLIISYFFLLIMQGKVLSLLIQNKYWQQVIFYSRWLLIILLVYFSIAYLFRYGPSVQKKWSILSPGAVLSTFLSMISSVLFALFVDNFGRYNALYGTIGTLMMVMALIFINSLTILIGFELNATINRLALQEQPILETNPEAETNKLLQPGS